MATRVLYLSFAAAAYSLRVSSLGPATSCSHRGVAIVADEQRAGSRHTRRDALQIAAFGAGAFLLPQLAEAATAPAKAEAGEFDWTSLGVSRESLGLPAPPAPPAPPPLSPREAAALKKKEDQESVFAANQRKRAENEARAAKAKAEKAERKAAAEAARAERDAARPARGRAAAKKKDPNAIDWEEYGLTPKQLGIDEASLGGGGKKPPPRPRNAAEKKKFEAAKRKEKERKKKAAEKRKVFNKKTKQAADKLKGEAERLNKAADKEEEEARKSKDRLDQFKGEAAKKRQEAAKKKAAAQQKLKQRR